MRQSYLYIICCLLFINTTLVALMSQEDTNEVERIEHTIDRGNYDELVNELDWSKTKKALRLKPIDTSKDKPKEKKSTGSFKFGGFGIQILGYIAVLVLIGFIIYILLDKININPRLEKSAFEIEALENIEDIEIIDAQSGLKEALANGDYRAALSMHYIIVLQHLTAEERIEWEPSKTNRDYIREMRRDEQGRAFSIVSNAYDFSLYGDRHFGKEEYESLLPYLELLSVPKTVSI